MNMKRNIILSVVAILLLAIFAGAWMLLLLLVLPVAWFFINRQGRKTEDAPDGPKTYGDVDDVTALYGQPDDVVVLDASRANELAGLLMFYPERDVVIVAGSELALSDIYGVAAKNMATPYTVDEWAVILNTRRRDWPTITLRVGYDGGLAADVAAQIDAHLQKA